MTRTILSTGRAGAVDKISSSQDGYEGKFNICMVYICIYTVYGIYMCSSASRACVAVPRMECSIVYRIYRREQCKRRSLKTTTLQHSPLAPPPQPPRPERSLYVKPIYTAIFWKKKQHLTTHLKLYFKHACCNYNCNTYLKLQFKHISKHIVQ